MNNEVFSWIGQGREHFRIEEEHVLKSGGDSSPCSCVTTAELFHPTWILASSQSFSILAACKNHLSCHRILLPRAALRNSDLIDQWRDLGVGIFYKPPR